MVGFAKSLRLPEERSSGRGALRLSALAITGAVHLLGIALFLWGVGGRHPPKAPRDAMHVVLMARSTATPVERGEKPARAAERPVATKSTASLPAPGTMPSTARLQETAAQAPQRILDRAALTQVRRAAPFPEIPSELPDELIVSMSLQFLITQPGRQMAAR
ncbi:MAG: hypothetical protein QM681_02635 [Novosphingobium sp.]